MAPLIQIPKTHCVHGHEFTSENTYWARQKNPTLQYRVCKTCRIAGLQRYQERYPDKHREWGKSWLKKNYARLSQDPDFLARRKRDKQLFRERHAERLKEWNRSQYWRVRLQVLALYGGKCAKCGFNDERALQIDHANGGGNREHRTIGAIQVYKRAIAAPFSGDYQLLCANCNWIKAYEAYEKERNVILNQDTI